MSTVSFLTSAETLTTWCGSLLLPRVNSHTHIGNKAELELAYLSSNAERLCPFEEFHDGSGGPEEFQVDLSGFVSRVKVSRYRDL